MKCLLSAITLLTLALSSCGIIPATVGENPPTADTSMQSTEESLATATIPETSVEVLGGNEESLREFIRQWIAPVFPDGTSQDVTVYVGSAPKEIPYDLPTPDDSRLIGSVTGNWVDYMLIFDTGLTSEEVQDFYAQALKEKGWQEAPMNQGGGFTSQSDLYKGYCYGENKAFLNVETPSLARGSTGIRLSLDVTPDSYMCNPNPNPGAPRENLIPQLNAPKGVLVQGSGAGSSDHDANISANLKGDLSAAEIADFYNDQLQTAGWKLQNSGDGEGAAWSNWTFQDDEGTDWVGALMVIEVSTESNSRFAMVTIEKSK
jgi:hypothetical protein